MKRTLIAAAALCLAASPALSWGKDPETRVAIIVATTLFAKECPSTAYNGASAAAAVIANGFELKAIEQPEMKRRVFSWLRKFQNEREASCMALWASFGPDGEFLPGILTAK